MKTKIANLTQQDILRNGDLSSNRESLIATLKQWRQKLGCYSIFATLPAMLVSQVQEARAGEANEPEASAARRTPRLLERLNKNYSNPELLKRQSQFRLPHQKGSFDILAALTGNDDCPGRAIPGGTYTSAAPYIASGDTTGANNTITSLHYYYYNYNFDASGPDHVYSFTLTGRGPNPQIQVSTTSGTYKPMIYVLQGGYAGACPSGTGNTVFNELVWSYSSAGTATIDGQQMNYLPLNAPLHLFVDSARNDASGSGPYTIRMQDVTIALSPNPIDRSEFFVPQHYLDFLNRQPDQDGLAFWTHEINLCGADQQCIEEKRINVSAAFFLSIEFQQTGYEVYRIYKAAYGNLPNAPVPIRLDEFLPDTRTIGQGVAVNVGNWQQQLESNKQLFLLEFVQRSRFVSSYPTWMSTEQFVDTLFANAGVTPSATDRTAAINEFGSAMTSADVAARARALRRVAENSTLAQQEFNRAFVLMQYFGYLRRNPNDQPEPTLDFQGYNFWLTKLDAFNSNFVNAEMVRAFITSGEYRQRFGP